LISGPRDLLDQRPRRAGSILGQKEEDTGYAVDPYAARRRECEVPDQPRLHSSGEPTTKEEVQEKVLAIGDQFVDASVEKKKVLRDFAVSMGYGAYCRLHRRVARRPGAGEGQFQGRRESAWCASAPTLSAAVSMPRATTRTGRICRDAEGGVEREGLARGNSRPAPVPPRP
jgi:hypothetical protein